MVLKLQSLIQILLKIIILGNKNKALIYSLGSALLVGTLKELVDHNQTGNRFDGRDLLATTYGGLTVGFTFTLFRKNKRHKQK